MKTRTDCAIHYGKAIVPSQHDVFSIPLNKNTWTDFSIPFNYPLFIGDIIDATQTMSEKTFDSLAIYQWVKTGASYRTEPVFLNGIRDIGDPADTIAGGASYSAYNATSGPIDLQIAPICMELSSYYRQTLQKKSPADVNAWSIRIGVIANTEPLSPIYCASTPINRVPRYYPLPPSFSQVKTGVFDRESNRMFGSAASGDLSSGGAKFEIVCENSTNTSSPIILFVDKTAGLPPDMKTLLFSTGSGESNHTADTLKIALNPKQKNTVFALVGTDEFARKAFSQLTSRLSFQAIPLAGRLKIVYSLPYNTRSVKFSMYNLKGRRIGDIQPEKHITPGTSSFIWQDQFVHGFYIIEIRATIEGSKRPQIIRQKVVYVR